MKTDSIATMSGKSKQLDSEHYHHEHGSSFTESTCSRITAFICICLLGFFTMVCYDLPGSLQTQIEKAYGVEPYQYEYLYSMYCLPNIFLAYCSGLLIDRVLGVKLSGLVVTTITLIGQVIFTIGGFTNSYWVLLVSRFIYGIGGDSIMVVINYYTVLWFSGRGLNFVFGTGVSVARLGTSFVFLASSFIYEWTGDIFQDHTQRIGTSFLISIVAGLLLVCTVVILGWESQRNGKLSQPDQKTTAELDHHYRTSSLDGSSVGKIVRFPTKFWLLTLIFVSFQTTVLVFVTCSQELLMKKYGLNRIVANRCGSVFNLVLAITSPLTGLILDKFGFNMMAINVSLVFAALSQTVILASDISAYYPLIVLGISCGTLYSSVPPLISRVVAPQQLGAAFGLSIGLSDLSLALLNILGGYLLGQYGYQATCLFYVILLLIGLGASATLWVIDRKDGGDLDKPDNTPHHVQTI